MRRGVTVSAMRCDPLLVPLVVQPSVSQAKAVEGKVPPAEGGMENSISAAQRSNSESGNSDSVSKNVDLRDPGSLPTISVVDPL
jgi:hypothetical protein